MKRIENKVVVFQLKVKIRNENRSRRTLFFEQLVLFFEQHTFMHSFFTAGDMS